MKQITQILQFTRRLSIDRTNRTEFRAIACHGVKYGIHVLFIFTQFSVSGIVALFNLLLLVIAGATQRELARQIRYLKGRKRSAAEQVAATSCGHAEGAVAVGKVRGQVGQGGSPVGNNCGSEYLLALDSRREANPKEGNKAEQARAPAN